MLPTPSKWGHHEIDKILNREKGGLNVAPYIITWLYEMVFIGNLAYKVYIWDEYCSN